MRAVLSSVLAWIARFGHDVFSRRSRNRWLDAFASVVDFARRRGGRPQTDPLSTRRLAYLSGLTAGMDTDTELDALNENARPGWPSAELLSNPYRKSAARGGFPPLERSPPNLIQLKTDRSGDSCRKRRWRCGHNPTARRVRGPALILGLQSSIRQSPSFLGANKEG